MMIMIRTSTDATAIIITMIIKQLMIIAINNSVFMTMMMIKLMYGICSCDNCSYDNTNVLNITLTLTLILTLIVTLP